MERDHPGAALLSVIEKQLFRSHVSASFGVYLQDLVRNHSILIRVSDETLGIDPAHDQGKVLCVF